MQTLKKIAEAERAALLPLNTRKEDSKNRGGDRSKSATALTSNAID